MFDVQRRDYRHRELFEQPADESVYFPPDLRQERATRMLATNKVAIHSCAKEESTKVVSLKTPEGRQYREITYRDWRVAGSADSVQSVEVVIGDVGSIIYGRCECDFFQEHLLNLGPCEHMLAIFRASENQRVDSSTSRQVDEARLRGERARGKPRDADESEDDSAMEDE
jgi:hypothetical protein